MYRNNSIMKIMTILSFILNIFIKDQYIINYFIRFFCLIKFSKYIHTKIFINISLNYD